MTTANGVNSTSRGSSCSRTAWAAICSASCGEQINHVFDVERDRAGHEFRTEAHAHRLANLVDKGEVFRRAILLPRVVECVRHVLGPQVKLSSLNARSADPNGEVPQPLHVDMSALPDEQGYWVCNTVWMLDDFTTENGATRVIPGSHKWGRRPQDVLEDPLRAASEEILVLGGAGSIAVMNAHAWHGGTANRTAAPRLAMHAFYCRRDKPQQQYQKQLLRPDVQDSLLARAARDARARRSAERCSQRERVHAKRLHVNAFSVRAQPLGVLRGWLSAATSANQGLGSQTS